MRGTHTRLAARRTRRVARSIALVVTMLTVPTVTSAQIPPSMDPAAGIAIGKTTLFPLVLLGYEHTNNVFYQPPGGDVESATIGAVQAGLGLDIPVSNSTISLAFARLWKDFSNAPTGDFWYGKLDAGLVFGNGSTLDIADDYENGVVEAQAFRVGAGSIPGGEIFFTGEPYHSNSASVEFGKKLGTQRGIGVRYGHDVVNFTGENEFGFYDLSADSLTLHGFERVGTRADVVWTTSALWNDLSRPQGADFNAATSSQRGLSAEAGFRLDAGVSGAVTCRLGGIRIDVSSASSFSYTGVIGSVAYERNDPERFYASAGYYRNVYPSPFSSSDLYVGDTFAFRVTMPTASRLLAGGEASYSRNDYPRGLNARVDEVVLARAWVGYRFGAALRWRVYAASSSRNSTGQNLDFNVTQYGTTLSWGL